MLSTQSPKRPAFFFLPTPKTLYTVIIILQSSTSTAKLSQEFRGTDQQTILENWKGTWVNSNCLTR